MIDKIELRRRIDELDSKHSYFFEAANASTINFIDIDNGRVTFKSGIIVDKKIWKEIKTVLDIND
jgi:hypothetical protein